MAEDDVYEQLRLMQQEDNDCSSEDISVKKSINEENNYSIESGKQLFDEKALEEDHRTRFKELLKEKKVGVFDSWFQIEPAIEKDERFQAIRTNKERKALFDKYCKENRSNANIETTKNKKLELKEIIEIEAMEYFKKNKDALNTDLKFTYLWNEFIKKYRNKQLGFNITRASLDQQTIFKNQFKKIQNQLKKSNGNSKEKASVEGFFSFLDDNKINEIVQKNKNIRWDQIRLNIKYLDARYRNIRSDEKRSSLFEKYKSIVLLNK